MDPLLLVLIVAGVASAFCWIASLITKDTSWVDRLWSIVPVVYVWIFAIAGIASGADAVRLIVMAVLVTAWGARLTFNFARKGGYTGVEDYRWAVLRGRMKPWQFQVFNLLLHRALPERAARPDHPSRLRRVAEPGAVRRLGRRCSPSCSRRSSSASTSPTSSSGTSTAPRRPPADTLEPGFVTTGLFAYSRHPNFFFEQAQWWAFYAIGAAAAAASGLGVWGGVLNWTIAGAALLTLLFIGSTIFTESITSSKYPAYADYQRRTSMLVPLPRRRGSSEAPSAA